MIGERLERLAKLGHHHQHDVEADLAERAGDEREEVDGFGDGVARHMPGDRRIAELEFTGIFAPHVEASVAERGERAGGAAELRDQHARLQFAQALGMAVHHGEPDRALVAEGDRQRLLQVGAAGHGGVAILFRESRQRGRNSRHVSLDDGERGADLQHRGGVHDVLRGRAPVHVAAGFAELLRKLPHQAEDRVADVLGYML